MNNNKKIKISSLVFIGLVFILGGIILFGIVGVKSKNPPQNQAQQIPQSASKPSAPIFAANFSLDSPKGTLKTAQIFPVALKFRLENTPANKGIIGIKAILKITPSANLLLERENIKETLPPPWQYLRKEITKDGEIDIEAVYLQSGKFGDLTKDYTLAILNFIPKKEGQVELHLERQKSKIIAKENNLDLSPTIEIYSNYTVIK